MRVTIGYSDSEDRLWLRPEGSNRLWWVTRRIALRLVVSWAQLLERSVAADGDAGEDGRADGDPEAAGGDGDAAHGASSRAARLKRAHAAAVTQSRALRLQPVERPAGGVALETVLLTTVELALNGDRFKVALKAPALEDRWTMTRGEAHAMLDALVARCRRSGWLEVSLPGWLDARPEAGSRPEAP